MQKSNASKNEMRVLTSYVLFHGTSTLHTALKESFAVANSGKQLSEREYCYNGQDIDAAVADSDVDHTDQKDEVDKLFLFLSQDFDSI